MIYSYKKYPVEKLDNVKVLKSRKKNGRDYLDIIAAFDIETTRLDDDNSVLYIWMCQIEDDTIIGRTWKEFKRFVQRLENHIHGGRLIMFVHNLSFEFQFLRSVFHFQPEEVFSLDKRRPVRADISEKIELRCSYANTNANLRSFLKDMGVKTQKGEMDYNKARFPWTGLTAEELDYCISDVKGLVEAMHERLRREGDTLATIPLTSTGYVRREVKDTLTHAVGRNWLKKLLPSNEVYSLLREAFRGGNTHANRFYAGMILENVHSYDRSSSYPDVQVNCLFPVTPFVPRDEEVLTVRKFRELQKRERAVLCRAHFKDVRLKDDMWGCPYIPRDKCTNISEAVYDNGRILAAKELTIAVTDIDLDIILSEYVFSDCVLTNVYTAKYGRLPQALIDLIKSYYKDKTALKGVSPEVYQRAKALLNAIYGMSAQNPVKVSIKYSEGGGFTLDREQREKGVAALLEEYRDKGWYPYQWGVWTTAHARRELERGLIIAHNASDDENGLSGFVYCDTDSVKYVGEADFSALNEELKTRSAEAGATANDPKGKTHYMGEWEREADYQEFATRGAKKYCGRIDGKLEATIAGVTKKSDHKNHILSGGEELELFGGVEAFLKEHFIFNLAGGNAIRYNDHARKSIKIDGHFLRVRSSATIVPSTYELRDEDYYSDLIANPDEFYYFFLDKYGIV